MKIVAEYVQDYQSYNMLLELGVDFAQGYYIGRPSVTPIRKSMPVPCAVRKQKKRTKRKALTAG
jgi:EAL domain-containing protein (putative c-di-GMP-specific phosphodiesterase class I)